MGTTDADDRVGDCPVALGGVTKQQPVVKRPSVEDIINRGLREPDAVDKVTVPHSSSPSMTTWPLNVSTMSGEK